MAKPFPDEMIGPDPMLALTEKLIKMLSGQYTYRQLAAVVKATDTEWDHFLDREKYWDEFRVGDAILRAVSQRDIRRKQVLYQALQKLDEV